MIELNTKQEFWINPVQLAYARYEEVVYNDKDSLSVFCYNNHKTLHIIEKHINAIIDIESGRVTYYVEKTEDYEPCCIEPHGQTLYSERFDNKEDAIKAYNSLTLEK